LLVLLLVLPCRRYKCKLYEIKRKGQKERERERQVIELLIT